MPNRQESNDCDPKQRAAGEATLSGILSLGCVSLGGLMLKVNERTVFVRV